MSMQFCQMSDPPESESRTVAWALTHRWWRKPVLRYCWEPTVSSGIILFYNVRATGVHAVLSDVRPTRIREQNSSLSADTSVMEKTCFSVPVHACFAVCHLTPTVFSDIILKTSDLPVFVQNSQAHENLTEDPRPCGEPTVYTGIRPSYSSSCHRSEGRRRRRITCDLFTLLLQTQQARAVRFSSSEKAMRLAHSTR